MAKAEVAAQASEDAEQAAPAEKSARQEQVGSCHTASFRFVLDEGMHCQR